MTEVTTLPRIGDLPEAFNPNLGFAKRVRWSLGYKPLLAEHRRYRDELRLLEACAFVGVRPFQTVAVEEYMEEKKHAHRLAKENRWYSWEEESLRSYKKPVPVEVLEKAAALRGVTRRIRFSVWEMQEFTDPFLMAKLGKARFYIAVWDEQSFDAVYD